MVYELDTLPHKENASWRCSARCFSAEILIPSHLVRTEQCQLAGTPVVDDAEREHRKLQPTTCYTVFCVKTAVEIGSGSRQKSGNRLPGRDRVAPPRGPQAAASRAVAQGCASSGSVTGPQRDGGQAPPSAWPCFSVREGDIVSTVVKARKEQDSPPDHGAYSEELLTATLEEIGRRRTAPQATYRIQLHSGFTFRDARRSFPTWPTWASRTATPLPISRPRRAARTATTSPTTACSIRRSARPMSMPPG